MTPRATVAAMVEVGAACLVSTTVCGALDPSLELGSLVVFDDLHFPSNRLADGSLCTLFTSPEIPGRGHWIYDRPFGERARAALVEGARDAGLEVRDGRLRSCGRPPLQLGQRDRPTGRGRRGLREPDRGPEAVLAGEARLPFALMGFVTDHANGVGAVPTPHETFAAVPRERRDPPARPAGVAPAAGGGARRAGRDPVRDLGPGPRPVRRRPGRHRLRA